MPPDLFEVFEKLAMVMDVEHDEYCDAAAKLLAVGRNRAG